MKKWLLSAFALGSICMVACSEGGKDTGGMSEESKGIVADLNVAGVAQKGPFVKGSAVTVQGIDCKTLKCTDEVFYSEVKSDKGDFAFDNVTLSSTCALLEVTGEYRSEITGKKSADEITLHALTDLKDCKNVNINVLTELEYERVKNLVTEKGKMFAEAKEQAEKEVLAVFDIKGDFGKFENLSIFESGDGNAALLAVSVMMQAEKDDEGLAERMDKFADSFAETGEWKDSVTKKAISEWAVEAIANGLLDSIRKNVESWNDSGTVPAFDKFIEAYAEGYSIIVSSASCSSSSGMPKSSSNEISESSSSVKEDAGSEYDASAKTLKDLRDGQTYRTVKIGNQIWMAENLNYEVSNSYCYKNSADSCAKYGRLYTWAASMDSAKTGCGYGLTCSTTKPIQGICPSGWHLPSNAEWSALIMEAGGPIVAGVHLKSQTDWYISGTDVFGFTALPAGVWSDDNGFFNVGNVTGFWTSSEHDSARVFGVYLDYSLKRVDIGHVHKDFVANSIRCLKDSDPAVSSSNSSESSSSSVRIAYACKMKGWDDCEYETLTDERDGQTYKTVKIGEHWWMAENLNFASLQPTDSLDSTSFCYDKDPDNCEKDGRLYLWSAVMDSAATWSDNGKGCGYGVVCSPTFPVRGVCPAGWHVPTRDEVMELIDAVGGAGVAGDMLISEYAGCIDEVDLYGFSFRATGRRRAAGYYEDDGLYGYMWTTTDDYWNSDGIEMFEYVAVFSMTKSGGKLGVHRGTKNVGYPVRCVMD